MSAKAKLFKGTILNPVSDRKCDVHRDAGLLCLEGNDGFKIDQLLDSSQLSKLDLTNIEVVDFKNKVLIPGLIDLHFHWVQDDVRERPKDNLLAWLENYTWPAEDAYKDEDFCLAKAREFSQKLINNGTIAGLCYGSIHDHSVEMAMNEFKGDFFIGNVLMTMNSPDYLLQTESEAQQSCEKLAKKFKDKYVVTPRFAPTTDERTMSLGAKMSKDFGCFIQSHLCETQNEIDWVLSIYRTRKGFEDVESYSDIYNRCGLLGPKTVMGHGVHLSDHDIELLLKTKTAIAHCPTSNAPVSEQGLGSGLFDYQKADELGLEWGLGSDIGAGPYLCMLDVMRSFTQQNSDKEVSLNVKALYRSTLKNAQIMNLEDKLGSFEKLKDPSFVVLDHVPESEDAEEVIASLLKSCERQDLSKKIFKTYVCAQEL